MCHRTPLTLILALLLALVPTVAPAETPVESNVDSRLTLAFQVREAELQTWLPAPWHVSPVPAGPSKGANFLVVFIQRLLSQTPDGKTSPSGGTDRGIALVVPAKHAQTGETSILVTRVYTTDHAGVPGPYKNSVKVSLRRELVLKGENLEPGAGSDAWEMKDASGGTMVVRLAYHRSLPTRGKAEQKIRSSVEPNFYRIYRVDQGAEVVKSVPAGIDRLQSYEFRSTVAELAKLLDSSAQLVSITAIPWYVRQVSLP
jgi:hypothetical protein